MTVTIYTTTTCPYCQMEKAFLDEKGVSYIEKFVDQDDSAKSEMSAESGGFLGVPFTVIEKDDNTKETVIGFDKQKLESVLGISQ